jgi:phosphatidylglycerophosphate synthase
LKTETARRLFSTYLEAPVASTLIKLRLSPNVLTLSGILFASIAAVLLGLGSLAVGGVVVLAASVFDTFDGAVARATGKESAFGALLDSTVDRVAESIILLGLLVFYVDRGSEWQSALVLVTLAGSYLVSYVRARAEGLGVECEVGIMQRPQRVALLGGGLIVGQWWLPAVWIVLAVVGALAAVTVLQRVFHARNALEEKAAGG